MERVPNGGQLRRAIPNLETRSHAQHDNQYILDDIKCLIEIESVCGLMHKQEVQETDLTTVTETQQMSKDMEKDFAPGLKRRQCKFIEPLKLVRTKDLHGWRSDAIDNLDAKSRESIIKHLDAAITSNTPVPAEKTRSKGHVMLEIIDGTPETARH